MRKTILRTKRLILRPLGTEDLDAFYEYAGDSENTKYMVYYPHHSKEQTKVFLERVEAEWQKENPEFYEFAVLHDGEHVGTATLYLEGDEGCGELAWMLHKKYWHKGYATEASEAVKEFAKSTLHLRRLTACCDCRNKASAAVMERLGMTFVGERERVYSDERGSAREYYYELAFDCTVDVLQHPEGGSHHAAPREVVAGMDARYALFGLLFAFQNRLQAVGDTFYEEITCKQFFLIACMNLFPKEAPTVQDLAQIMGSSHQNVKQILNKLEQKGFVSVTPDEADRRKLRIRLTEYAGEMAEKYREKEEEFMTGLFAGVETGEARQAFATLSKMEENLMKLRVASKDVEE